MSREIDALIAEKVMGLVKCQADSHKPGGSAADWVCYAAPESPDQGGECRPYSSDIAAAWDVVEKMGQWNGFEFMLTRTYKAHVGMEDWSAGWVEWDAAGFEWRALGEHGTSVPMAICLAALKAVGVSAQSPKEKS